MSSSRPHFGTDGVRGTFGENLTPDFVYSLGRAAARVLGTDVDYLIGRDTRISGPILSNALIDGLKFEGATTNDVGILSTPGIATIARRDSLRACAITASHNPAADNGVKVFDVGGVKIDSSVEKKIEDELEKILSETKSYEAQTSESEKVTDATKDYVTYLLDSLEKTSLTGLKIVLDCANGAAYGVAPVIFILAGAKVVAINTESDGIHINENCGATHLSELILAVRSNKADIGFAFDGDADRVIAVDNSGNVCDGDVLIGLFATDMKSHDHLRNNTVVATSMSNGALRIFLKEKGIEFSETSVGDKYVLEEMLANGYSLGGEQSGHIIRTDFATWGDGILNALLVAKILSEYRAKDPSITSTSMLSLFTPLIQLHDKIHVLHKGNAEKNEMITKAIERERGLLGPDARVIIRPSGTEDVVRITVEGLIEKSVQESIARLAIVVQEVCA